MFKSYPLVSRFLVFIFTPLIFLLIYGFSYLKGSLPVIEGKVILTELSFPVSVLRDDNGVVFIEAKTDLDAFASLGYVHAQDRLWQLELQKRLVQGRLSEVFGKGSIGSDSLFRTLGLYQSAKQSWNVLSQPAKDSLIAYTSGINSWLNSNSNLPIEFKLLEIEPEQWTVYDSLAWLKAFALDLSGNYRQELNRMISSGSMSPGQLKFFFPEQLGEPQLTLTSSDSYLVDKLDELGRLLSEIEAKLNIGGRYVGSNAWVVSAKNSVSGASIIANDPHLSLQIPSYWYVTDLQGDNIKVSGMSLVGLPVIIFGKNEYIAWAGTNLMADAQDLYFETQNVKMATQYSVGSEWHDFESRTELIKVRSEFPESLREENKPLKLRIRKTRHGPIISDLVGLQSSAVALKWTALDEKDTSYEAFYRLNYATDWNSFKASLSYHVAPALNMLFSDFNGNIGYMAAGKIPVRKTGIGQYPVSGDTDDFEWQGYIPFNEMPQQYNPASGIIVSANNKIVDSGYPYFISSDWASPIRALRILELLKIKLNNNGKLSIEDMKNIQADTHDSSVNQLLGKLLSYKPQNELQRTAFDYLKGWDGNMQRDSQAASIFYSWIRYLRVYLYQDELEGFWNKSGQKSVLVNLVDNVSIDILNQTLSNDKLGWCDDINTVVEEECGKIVSDSLDSAITSNQRLLGDSTMQSWSWESLHHSYYQHIPFSQVKILDKLFERRIGNGGSPDSINVASASYDSSLGFVQNFGPGFRQIIELDPENVKHIYMNSTGQSGNVLSEHYDNMIEPFRNVQYYSLNKDAKNTKHLQLFPATDSTEKQQ